MTLEIYHTGDVLMKKNVHMKFILLKDIAPRSGTHKQLSFGRLCIPRGGRGGIFTNFITVEGGVLTGKSNTGRTLTVTAMAEESSNGIHQHPRPTYRTFPDPASGFPIKRLPGVH